MKYNWHRMSRFTHKWLSLIIGLQVLFWFVSGFVMTFLHIDTVRGNHLVKKEVSGSIDIKKLVSWSNLPQLSGIKALHITLRQNRPIIVAETGDGSKAYSALTGEDLPNLTGEDAGKVAGARLVHVAKPIAVSLLHSATREFDREIPIWKLDYNEPESFSLYVSPVTGEIKAVRNTKWRIFDFFWMLHIMDYTKRENINSPWIIVLAGLAVVLTLSGFGIAWNILRKKRPINFG